MKKKLTLLFVALMMVVAANAQFQEGKGYWEPLLPDLT